MARPTESEEPIQTQIEVDDFHQPTLLREENQDFLIQLDAIGDYEEFQTYVGTEQAQVFDKMVALLQEARAEEGRWIQAYQKTQKVVKDANIAIA